MIIGGLPLLLKTQETDPFFDDVIYLLHMDGSDGSTTFTDEIGNTWTANDNAQIDTAISKFGGASGLFDGTTDSISTPYTAGNSIASGDFTIEGWAYRDEVANSIALAGQRDNGSANAAGILLYFPGGSPANLRFLSAVGGTVYNINLNATTTFSATTWTHVAVTRESDTFRLFVGGNLEGSATQSGSINKLDTNDFTLGADSDDGLSLDGNLDEWRVTKGTARYTASFTPPTKPFPDA